MSNDLFTLDQMAWMMWFQAAIVLAPPLILLAMLELEEWHLNVRRAFENLHFLPTPALRSR